MIRYVVVTREGLYPVERYHTIEAAGDKIVREAAFGRWTVKAQEANRITASTPYRELLPYEKKALQKKLFPTLFE